jgi:esterase
VDLAGVLRAVPLGEFTSRAEVEAALATSIPDRAVRAFLMQNLRRGADGLIWSLNLEALKRHADTIRDFPQVTGDLAFTGPTLFLLGGRSTYVERRHEADMHRLFPTAVIERIEAAGHWVHAEAPDAFLAAIRRFLAR